MVRFRATVSYNGSSYLGFQVQPQEPTIQQILEEKLAQILQETPRVTPSGRTDTGVHALKQVVHFDLNDEKAIARASAQDFAHRWNQILPADICILSCEPADDNFHARKSMHNKTYTYWFFVSQQQNPFLENLAWRISYDLDIKAMQNAAEHLLGEHDFSSFCATDSNADSKIRTIEQISITADRPAAFWQQQDEMWYKLEIKGNGFLKQMVRNIMGTLVEVGRGKIAADNIPTIIQSQDRRQAGPTAPSQGLYLTKAS